MINLNGNKVVEMCQRVRKATDRRRFFHHYVQIKNREGQAYYSGQMVCSWQMTGRRQRRPQNKQLHSIHQASLIGNCSFSYVRQFTNRTLEIKRAGKITLSIDRIGKGYIESSPQSGRFKIRARILVTIHSLFGEINCFEN